jgi:hypothetical protein
MTMNMKYAICGIALAALVTPAVAANEFHVVMDSTSKKCSIAEQKPTTANMSVVSTAVYATKAEAEAGMKTIKACESK